MPVNFLNFFESTTPADTDYIVGFADSNKGGERRWSVSTMANKIAPTANSVAKAWAVIYNSAAAAGGNGPFTLTSGYNVSSAISTPSGGTGSDNDSLRISFTKPIPGTKCVVFGSTYGNAYIGRKVTATEDSNVLTASYLDILWVDSASKLQDYLCVVIYA